MYLNHYQHLKNKETFVLIFLVLISVIIRIPVILIFGDTGLDNEWKIIVDNLIEHRKLSFRNFDGYLLPNLYMPPLYPFYLYFFSIFSFQETIYIKLILSSQILLSSLSVVIFYKINKIFFSHKISFYSSLIFSLFPLHVYACSQISSISLQTFFTILFFYLFFLLVEKRSFMLITLFSFIAGLLMLLRSEFILIIFFTLIYLYCFFKIPLKTILLIFLISLITISPYLIRNIITFEKVTITKSFGYNLWKGNNLNSIVEGSEFIDDNLQNQINKIPKNVFYQINFDQVFLDQAVKNITNEPFRYLNLFFKKFLSFLFIDIQSTGANYYNPFHYLPVLLLGLTSFIGIILFDKKSYKLNYLILIFFTYVAIFSCFFILPRYKLIILPLQIIFSNILVDFINKKLLKRNR